MKRLVIFGAGYTGKLVLEAIGKDWVECFVDNRSSMVQYCGVKVIGIEQLIRIYDSVVIIVASYDYAEDICKQLDANNMSRYYVYQAGDYERFMEYKPFYYNKGKKLMYSYEKLINEYRIADYKKIAIYCYEENLSILLCILDIYGVVENVKYIICDSDKIKFSNNNKIDIVTLQEAESDIDCLILAVRRQDSKLDYYSYSNTKYAIADFYNVDQFISEFYCKEIVAYKNKFRGKRCFLIGNGPSLRVEDMDTLYKNKEITFASNKIYMLFDKTQWRPDFFCVSDPVIYQENYETINELKVLCKIYTDLSGFEGVKNLDDGIKLHLTYEEYAPNLPETSEDVAVQTFWGYTVIYDIMFQVAVYMGFSEIYLLGVDNTITNNPKKQKHFCENYFSEREQIQLYNYKNDPYKVDLAYKKMELYSINHGIKIYNATRGGKLEVFERINFNKLLS